MKHSKAYLKSAELITKGKDYPLPAAIELLKQVTYAKLTGSVEVAFNLNIDPSHSEQQLRGIVNLPHGSGKTKRVLTLTSTKYEEAKKAGSDYVGYKEEIEKISKGWFDFDVIVATPEVMIELSKLGKVLGPKGLMPNPKIGTLTTDVEKAIKEIKAGKVNYRSDKQGNVHVLAGLATFDNDKLEGNIRAIYDQIVKVKPSTVKGVYIKSVHISSTMSPSIKVAAL
jgi:large subunit ribosomal protein L1